MAKSIFEDIPGMGPKRIQKLWQEFESIKDIQRSKVEKIKEKTGFSKELCEAIQARSAGLKS